MTPVEVAHRALRAAQAHAERSGLLRAPTMPAPDLAAAAKPWIHRPSVEEVGGIETAPYLAIFPGLAISVVVLAFNMLGDALRDLLDPRLRSR